MSDKLKKFCPRMDGYVSIQQNGTYDICCDRDMRCSSHMTPSSHTIDEFFDSEHVANIKKAMEAESFPVGCEFCERDEHGGRSSLRQFLLSRDMEPRTLHIHVGNHCNSDCVMCGPINSTSIANRLRKHPDAKLNYFQPNAAGIRNIWRDEIAMRNVIAAAEKSDRIVFVGGEPMLYREFWEFMRLPMIQTKEVCVVTNGSVEPTEEQVQTLAQQKNLHLVISVDAIGDTYEWIRQGLSWRRLLKNLVLFRTIKDCYIAIACVVQAHNVSNLPEHLKFFSAFNLEIDYKDLIEPEILRASNLPKYVIEESLGKIQLNGINNSKLTTMLESYLREGPTHSIDDLIEHTTYLNGHRRQEFSTTNWKINDIIS